MGCVAILFIIVLGAIFLGPIGIVIALLAGILLKMGKKR